MKMKTYIPLTILLLFSLVFAVSGDLAAKKNKSNNPYIGVYAQPLDEDIIEAFNLEADEGIIIVDIMDDSPADEAGLQREDIIILFNGEKVDGSTPLKDFVNDTKVGDDVKIIFVREGKQKDATIVIGGHPRAEEKQIWVKKSGGPQGYTRTWTHSAGTSGYIGIGIQDLNDQLGQYFGVKDGEGVLITEVFEDSPAKDAGLKAGDVVFGVDGEEIASTSDLYEIISDKEDGDEVEIEFLRKGSKDSRTVKVTEDEVGMNAFTVPNIGHMPMNLDKNLQYHFFNDDDDDHIVIRKVIDIDKDEDNDKDDIKELRDELKAMRKELNELREKIE
ncbi:MAG: PDZ domain-containing protein [candidate division Zixibacteria bacterium]|nr:PDZ domain-containing protein [candidate division Zixibacteria bacterium]